MTQRQGDKETGRQGDNETTIGPDSRCPPFSFSPCPDFRPLIATCFGLGCSPIMPGTCGALLGPAIYIPLALVVTSEPLQTTFVAVALAAWCWITVALG